MAITPLPSDPTMLAASASVGNDRALGRLLALYEPAAFAVAYRLLKREADARDAVQEAYLRAVRAIRDGAPPRDLGRFKPWLMRIVANAALAQLRRRTPFEKVPVDTVAEALPTPERLGPAPEAERRESRVDVLRALMTLPHTQRMALALREYEGLSYDEIAAMLDLSRSAVETLLFRARRGFRAAYEGLASTPQSFACRDLAPLLSAMLDEEVSLRAWKDLMAYLDRCTDCRAELEDLRRTRRLCSLIPL